jgi:hypothetical protein
MLLCAALAALAACSGDDHDGAKPNGSADAGAPPTSQATGGTHSAATGGTSAVTGGLDAGHGTGGAVSHPSGTGGHAASDAATPPMTDAGDDSAPDYGMPALHPDTSTDKVSDCTGKPDMTLCDVATTPDRWYDVCVDEQCVSPGCGDQTCNTPGPHFRIPPFTDHDALQFQSGDEPVTIDLITGLHWQSCSAGKSGADCKTGEYMMVVWKDALAYCDALSWGGHDDWYLPDPYELTSIMEDDIAPDADAELSPTAFPNAIDAPLIHWSSAWLGDGAAMAISTSKTSISDITTPQNGETQLAVRCVRRGFSGATSPAHARYTTSTDAANPVFTDNATGLTWPSCLERIPDATECSDLLDKVTIDRAVDRCAKSQWGGSSAWRVPTFKELHGLIQYPRDTATTAPLIDARVVEPAGYFLVSVGHLFTTDGRRVDLMGGTYPYLCVRGPVVRGD